jgi:molybdopterin molybdotransferase
MTLYTRLAMDDETPQRITRLTPLADVLARIDAQVKQAAPREVETSAAAGRVLAGDVRVVLHPRVPLALRDGWAVRAELTTDAGSYAPAPLPGATRIDVGEPMPGDADAVAPLEVVVMRGGRTEIIAPVAAGDGVLPAGADADRDQTLARQGRRLTPIQAAVLAGAAVERVHICEPRVRLVRVRAVGDDVIDAAMHLIAGEVAAVGGRILGDEQGTSAARLDAALSDDTADAIIAVGGTGSGRHDASERALARIGRVEAHGIALSPGETAAFGFVGPRPVLILPGRLDSALAVWLVIGRRLLARLSGDIAEETTTKARLSRKVASSLGLTEVVPMRMHDGAAEPIASGYVPLSALAQADGWLLVPADSEGYPRGAEVVIRPWP